MSNEQIEKDFEIVEQLKDDFVLKVRHKKLGYFRVIKTPESFKTGMNEERKKKVYDDFVRECKTLMCLSGAQNPNIVQIYKCEIDEEPYYIEMDYVDGEHFDHYAETHYLSFEEVCLFIKDIANALACCHNHKDENGQKVTTVHNDLHSQNIIRRSGDGKFILIDFGLSFNKKERVRSSIKNAGYCEFIPPEKLNGESDFMATPAWDIYSLGCLIYLALTGRAPFSSKELSEFQIQLMHTEVNVHKPWEKINYLRQKHFNSINAGKEYVDDIPSWIISMVEKCMSLDPAKRYQDAQEFVDEFNLYYYKKSVSFDAYIEEQTKRKELEKELAQHIEYSNSLQKEVINIKNRINVPIKRNWIVSIVLVIAFISNCLSPLQDGFNNESIKYMTIAISTLASIVVIGIAIFDTIKKIKNE